VFRHVRRIRGLITAIAIVAVSAGVALAARPASAPPATAADGLQRAGEAAGKVLPVSDQEAAPVPAVVEETAPDPATPPEAPVTAEHADNHGKLVSEAAKGEHPAGSKNHGQYVKSVATANHGQETSAAARAAAAAKGAGKTKPTR
jgi:hypothetical protein